MTNDTTLSQPIAQMAEKALLYEVSLSPKPGLVDRYSNGAHKDMDFFTFIDSIVSLTPYFKSYFNIGFQHTGSDTDLFQHLRQVGALAEKAMLTATHNVNTHKGANFSLAVLLGATGLHVKKNQLTSLPLTKTDTEQILSKAGHLTNHLIEYDFQDLSHKSTLTHGEKLYLTHGITGIRGEAAAGYPSLSQLLLPFLRHYSTLYSKEELLLRALVFLMSEVEDGNLLHRGGIDAWEQIKIETKKIHQANLTKEALLDELTRYDQVLIERHLSPGGTADLLVLGIFFAQLEDLF